MSSVPISGVGSNPAVVAVLQSRLTASDQETVSSSYFTLFELLQVLIPSLRPRTAAKVIVSSCMEQLYTVKEGLERYENSGDQDKQQLRVALLREAIDILRKEESAEAPDIEGFILKVDNLINTGVGVCGGSNRIKGTMTPFVNDDNEFPLVIDNYMMKVRRSSVKLPLAIILHGL